MGDVVPPRHPTAGQASVEYIAAVTLTAAVLAAAGTAVGAPGIGHRVVHGIRLGICIVAGDVCRPSEAAAAGLAPCTITSATRGREGQVEFFFVTAASGDAYTVSRDSEGRVTVVKTHLDKAGLQVGAELGLGWFSVGADAGAGFRVARSTAWTFPDLRRARGFILGLPTSAQRPSPNLAWRSFEGGPETEATIAATLAGHTLAGLTAGADAAAGTRIGRDGSVTVYFKAQLQRPGPAGDLVWGPGGNAGNLLAEYTLVHGVPREIAFRRLESSAGGARLVETVARLDLRDAANRAAAAGLLQRHGPWPPAAVSPLLRRIAQAGTIERATYAVHDHSNSFDASIKLGEELGLQVAITRTEQHLVSAGARTRGSPERERFDCEPRPS
jgi:hypothetical protein